MPNFESPIGNKKIAGNAMRTFEVSDESGYEEPQVRNQSQNMPIDENSIRELQTRLNQQYPPQPQYMPQPQFNPIVAQKSDADIEKEIREARIAKITGKEKITDSAKKRIEMLVGMVRLTREVNIDGNVFVLRTLKSKEMREAMTNVLPFDGTIQAPYEIRSQLLARSLTHVAGIEIDHFIGSNTFESKILFLEELDDGLLTRLYNEYVILADTSKNKYAIKTEEDVKEVMEDLKK